MSLVGKLSAEILIVTPHHEHHGFWSGRPHHFSNVSPRKIKKVHLHEEDWGSKKHGHGYGHGDPTRQDTG